MPYSLEMRAPAQEEAQFLSQVHAETAGPVGVPLRERSWEEAEEWDGEWKVALQWRERRSVAYGFPETGVMGKEGEKE